MTAREQIREYGADQVSDLDLLRQLIVPGEANRLMEEYHDLQRLASLSQKVMEQYVSSQSARRVYAALQLGRRSIQSKKRKPGLSTPQELAEFLVPKYGAFSCERFGIVSMDTKYGLLKSEILYTGTLDSVRVHPREVFGAAIRANAACIAIWHNHPSGDSAPSADDVQLAARLGEAGRLMGIEVVDALILAPNNYYSFKEAGRL